MIGADLAVLFVPFLDGSSNRVEAGTDLEAGGCFSLSAVTTSDVGVITLSPDAIILTAAVTSPTKSLELTIFLKSVAHGGGRLVFFGRTARSSAKDVCLSANCPI